MDFSKVNYNNLIISILILFAAGYVYDKFKLNISTSDKVYELNIIKKYLLNEHNDFTLEQLSSIKKPILWIPIDYEKNSRKWESFGTRNSNELNQDYLYLTLRSIINKNSDYFHIILIDDDSYKLLLDNWSIELNKIGDPQKTYFRKLALAKVLYKFGGILMEPSFVMFKSLENIYNNILKTKKISVCEFPNKSSNSQSINTMPSMNFIGCIKECPKMHEFVNHLEILFSKDYTNEINIEDLINKWLFYNTQNKEIEYIDGKYLGIRDSNNKLIELDRLLGSSFLELNNNSYGLYIPKDDLLKRNAYNWFVYLNSMEVLESNTNIGKYLLISNN